MAMKANVNILIIGWAIFHGVASYAQDPKSVRPILECILEHGDGAYSAFFGYLNENSEAATIPVGGDNFFTPAPLDRGQTTLFEPGRSPYYPSAAFHLLWDGTGNVVWTLTGPDGTRRTSTVGLEGPRCAEKLPEGASCSVDAQCASGTCGEGHCVSPLDVDVAIIRAQSTLVDCENSTCFTIVPVSDLNGTPGTQCPGCEGSTYQFEDLVDVWALMYGGLHHDGTVSCNSDVRWTIAGQGHPDAGFETPNSTDPTSYWEYFFDTCSDEVCGSHHHLWRQSDTSEVTALLKALTGIASFCNGTHYQDNDPIRRECYENGNQNEDVCSKDGTLGLVLPVIVPSAYTANHNLCASGRFRWRQGAVALQPKCEDGSPSVFGMCLIPVDLSDNAGCISPPHNFAMFTPANSDTRAFNRVLREPSGAIVRNEERMEVVNAYFRMHEAHTATPSATTCHETSSAAQIDCMIQASGCSTGYAPRGEAHLYGTTELALCDGAVIIDIDINICPEITYLNVAPLVIGVGGNSNLTAMVSDADSDPLTLLWTATSGTIADPSALTTTYTCMETGSHTITFTVEDPDGCFDETNIPLICN